MTSAAIPGMTAPASSSSAAATSACTPRCACSAGCAASSRRGRDHRRRPPVVHDLPAVPARGGGRAASSRATWWSRCAGCCDKCGVITGASSASTTRARSPGSSPHRGEAYDLAYDHLVRGAGLGRADPADPGSGRGRHRLQAASRRRSTCATTCSTSSTSPTSVTDPETLPAGADLRLRRRRLRRHRGAGRARGHGRGRDCRYYPDLSKPATCASCSSRPPAGSCPRSARTWALHRRRAARARHRRPAGDPARVLRRRARRAVRRRGVRHRHDRLDRRGQGRTRCSRDRPAAGRARAGSRRRASCGSRASTAPGPPATAPPCPT